MRITEITLKNCKSLEEATALKLAFTKLIVNPRVNVVIEEKTFRVYCYESISTLDWDTGDDCTAQALGFDVD